MAGVNRGPQNKRVHKESDQLLGFKTSAPTDRDSHSNISLATIPGQHNLKRCQHSHEHGNALSAAEIFDGFRQARSQRKVVTSTAWIYAGCSWNSSWQLQRLQSR